MRSQRVRHNWATELKWTELNWEARWRQLTGTMDRKSLIYFLDLSQFPDPQPTDWRIGRVPLRKTPMLPSHVFTKHFPNPSLKSNYTGGKGILTSLEDHWINSRPALKLRVWDDTDTRTPAIMLFWLEMGLWRTGDKKCPGPCLHPVGFWAHRAFLWLFPQLLTDKECFGRKNWMGVLETIASPAKTENQKWHYILGATTGNSTASKDLKDAKGGGGLYHILVELTCLISAKSDGGWWVMTEQCKPYQVVFPPTAAILGVLSWLEQVTLLLVFGKWKWKSLNCKVAHSLWPHGLYSPWNSSGQNTGVGSCSLLQGVFPTQGLNPGLPHCRRILNQLSHPGTQEYSCG